MCSAQTTGSNWCRCDHVNSLLLVLFNWPLAKIVYGLHGNNTSTNLHTQINKW